MAQVHWEDEVSFSDAGDSFNAGGPHTPPQPAPHHRKRSLQERISTPAPLSPRVANIPTTPGGTRLSVSKPSHKTRRSTSIDSIDLSAIASSDYGSIIKDSIVTAADGVENGGLDESSSLAGPMSGVVEVGNEENAVPLADAGDELSSLNITTVSSELPPGDRSSSIAATDASITTDNPELNKLLARASDLERRVRMTDFRLSAESPADRWKRRQQEFEDIATPRTARALAAAAAASSGVSGSSLALGDLSSIKARLYELQDGGDDDDSDFAPGAGVDGSSYTMMHGIGDGASFDDLDDEEAEELAVLEAAVQHLQSNILAIQAREADGARESTAEADPVDQAYVDELRRKVSEAEIEREERRLARTLMEDEIEALTGAVRKLETAALVESLKAAEAEVEEKTAHVAALRELKQAVIKREESQADIESLCTALADNVAAAEALKAEKARLEAMLEAERALRDEIAQERDAHHAEREASAQQVDSLYSNLASLQVRMEEVEAEKERLAATLQVVRAQTAAEIEAREAAAAQLAEEVDALQTEVVNERNAAAATAHEAEQANAELHHLKATLEKSERMVARQMEAMKIELESLERRAAQKEALYQAEKLQKTALRKEMEDQIKVLEAKIEVMRKRERRDRDQMENMLVELNENQTRRPGEESNVQVSQLAQELAATKEELFATDLKRMQEMEASSDLVHTLKKALTIWQQETAELTIHEAMERAKKDFTIAQLEEVNAALRARAAAQLADAEREREALEDGIAALKHTVRDLNNENEARDAAFEAERQRFAAYREETAAEIERLTSMLAKMRRRSERILPGGGAGPSTPGGTPGQHRHHQHQQRGHHPGHHHRPAHGRQGYFR